ncbi:NUDIX domain-containing protein (plasmid) [Pantoea agglomerans]|uniref:NUDIX hydrolase n=1 Tax=Enterobacter agglomerans TaxID=549 RepID=UPI001AA034C5|nr:NUDIX domain-containing protein [Pantoea agglomerans]QTC52621.1 NUDIX domain-containing protein [Pantoea agglomerans]
MRSIIGHRMLLLGGANVIIARSDGHILLQQRTDSTWGLPNGLPEPGESLELTAVREVKEETSIDIHSLNFLKIFSGQDYSFILHNRDEINVITALYFTDNWSGDLVNDAKEGLALEFFSASRLPSPMNNEYVMYIKYFVNSYRCPPDTD